jgi:glycerol uptake facilitator-like aquaporin
VPSLAQALAAEAIGTFALVFAGAIMVDEKTGALGHVGIALTFGLVIMAMIYAVGHISGAHFNPAVSFAIALTCHFPLGDRRDCGSGRPLRRADHGCIDESRSVGRASDRCR